MWLSSGSFGSLGSLRILGSLRFFSACLPRKVWIAWTTSDQTFGRERIFGPLFGGLLRTINILEIIRLVRLILVLAIFAFASLLISYFGIMGILAGGMRGKGTACKESKKHRERIGMEWNTCLVFL